MASGVKFLGAEEFHREWEKLRARSPAEAGYYKNWKRYHEALCSVARMHDKVSDSPDPVPDFYYSGDWSRELADGFALCTAKGLSVESLRELQKVVAAHDCTGSLSLEGDVTTPLFGLDILITPTEIFISWHNESAEGCRARVEALGGRL